jgi:hypothetical protein
VACVIWECLVPILPLPRIESVSNPIHLCRHVTHKKPFRRQLLLSDSLDNTLDHLRECGVLRGPSFIIRDLEDIHHRYAQVNITLTLFSSLTHKPQQDLQAAFRDPTSPYHIPEGSQGPASPDEQPSILSAAEEGRVYFEDRGFDSTSLWEQPIAWGDHDAFQYEVMPLVS